MPEHPRPDQFAAPDVAPGAVPTFGGTTDIDTWVAAGKALPVGSVDVWERLSPTMVEQWRTDLNAGLRISQIPGGLSTVAFYWECAAGHLWRETPNLRRDSGRKTPRWKKVAGTRAACRECTLEQHGARYGCGCIDPDIRNVGNTYPANSVCEACSGVVRHRWACGNSGPVHVDNLPAAGAPCPECLASNARLNADPDLLRRFESMATHGLPTGHQPVEFWCGIDHHPPFRNNLYGIALGYGCQLCYKYDFTPGSDVTPGHVFRARSYGATSKVESRLRDALAEHYRVSNPDDANAVRIEGDFYGFKHVLPDILIPSNRIAVELDSPGRDQDSHRGAKAERDRLKDARLDDVGWTVIRVRIGGLEDVDHARCVVAKSLTNTAIAQVVDLVADLVDDRARSGP
jgi:hypothetical protein